MKRYIAFDPGYNMSMIESPNGDWVKYSYAQAEIERLRDALDQIAKLYERDSCAGSMHLAQLFYDARCVARATLSTETPDAIK